MESLHNAPVVILDKTINRIPANQRLGLVKDAFILIAFMATVYAIKK